MFSEKYKIIKLTETGSTNLHASALLSGKMISTPAIIITDYQHHGKGQGRSAWDSEAGKNVLLSIVQFPVNIKAFEQFYISKITALAVYETIKVHSGRVVIKWPNDVLVGIEKIAGILIENTIEEDQIKDTIIGIGINVNQVNFPPFPLKAASIKMISGREISLQPVIEMVIERFEFWYEIMESRDFDQIDKEYMKCLYGFQKLMSFRREGEIFEARITDIEKDGQLVLLMSDKKKMRFGYKELEFIIPGSD